MDQATTPSTPTPTRSAAGRRRTSAWGVFGVREDAIGSPLGDVAGLDVVELGCGTAYFSAQLAYRGARPVGVDPTPAQLATARRMQAAGGPVFPLVEAPAERVPLPDASFDLAFSEYGASLWADPAMWIPEAARLLRPNGRLVFLTNSVLAYLCCSGHRSGRRDAPASTSSGCTASEWPDDVGTEYHLSHGDWIRSCATPGSRSRTSSSSRRRPTRDARVLRLRDRRLGSPLAGRGDLGRAQARLSGPKRPARVAAPTASDPPVHVYPGPRRQVVR